MNCDEKYLSYIFLSFLIRNNVKVSLKISVKIFLKIKRKLDP
jgi:hypothetical protein